MAGDRTSTGQFPGFIQCLENKTTFNFACHKELPCFTECCRLLDLALSPYDVLRLRRATGLVSGEFLDRYVLVEQEKGEAFPRLYLTMIDDGRGSCVFVSQDGCTVYEHRPGACRAYPVGRGAKRLASGAIDRHFVLVKEEHCLGFRETAIQTAEQYCTQQGLAEYNMFNDALSSVLHHEKVRQGYTPSPAHQELFLLMLFDLDRLRAMLTAGEFDSITPETAAIMAEKTDEALLLFAIKWLEERLLA